MLIPQDKIRLAIIQAKESNRTVGIYYYDKIFVIAPLGFDFQVKVEQVAEIDREGNVRDCQEQHKN